MREILCEVTKKRSQNLIIIITDNNDDDCAISKIRKTAFKQKYVIANAAFFLGLNNLSVSSFTGFFCVME